MPYQPGQTVIQAAHAAGIDRIRRVAHRRHRVQHLEELPQARDVEIEAMREGDRLLEPRDEKAGKAGERNDLAHRGQTLQIKRDADNEDRKHCQGR